MDFTGKDNEKVGRLNRLMEENELDALVLRLGENLVYVSGYWPFYGQTYLFLPRDHEPLMVCPVDELPYAEKSWIKNVQTFSSETPYVFNDHFVEAIQKIQSYAKDLRLLSGRIGYEASMEFVGGLWQKREYFGVGRPLEGYLRRCFPRARLVDASELLYHARALKSKKEIEILRLVNEVADKGLETFRTNMLEGKTEAELAAKVEYELATGAIGRKGIERIFPVAYVMSGANTANAYKIFNIHTSKKLRKGDLVLIELNVCVEGYWSDTTRTHTIGAPSPEQKKIAETVLSAQEVAVKMSRDRARASKVNDAAFEVIRKAGYGDYLRHRVGHGIGCALHEPIPAIHHASRHSLRASMVHSIEPGVYVPTLGGVRIEDMVITGDTRGESLNKATHTLK